MDPKMTLRDAARILGVAEQDLHKRLRENFLDFKISKAKGSTLGNAYFGYKTAAEIFNFHNKPKAVAFQIVKGGTGKTSLAFAVAVRANLLGQKVLVIDLDQQGNITQAFDVDAETVPVMIDILAEDYKYVDAITNIYPGLDLIASRIENALIDDVIKLKKQSIDRVYKDPLTRLKSQYDLIIIDCPPNLGQSVAAVALGVDMVIAPVVPESFALSGLKTTANTIRELEEDYKHKLTFKIVLNKFDGRTVLSKDVFRMLSKHPAYAPHLLKTKVRNLQDYSNAIARGHTIFDSPKPSFAKQDIDNLTLEILGANQKETKPVKTTKRKVSKLEASLL